MKGERHDGSEAPHMVVLAWTDPKACPTCGHVRPGSGKFCRICGQSVYWSDRADSWVHAQQKTASDA